MNVSELKLGQHVEYKNQCYIVMGIFSPEFSSFKEYKDSAHIYVVVYPYYSDIFDSCLSTNLVKYCYIDDLYMLDNRENIDSLKAWILKSTLQDQSIPDVLNHCNFDIELGLKLIQEKRIKFLQYENNCYAIFSKQLKNPIKHYEFGKVYKCTNYDVCFVYLGKDTFFKIGISTLYYNSFLVDADYIYDQQWCTKGRVSYENCVDIGINLCDFEFNKKQLEQVRENI